MSIASSMIKSVKREKRERIELVQLELPTFPSWGVFVLYSNFSLVMGKINS